MEEGSVHPKNAEPQSGQLLKFIPGEGMGKNDPHRRRGPFGALADEFQDRSALLDTVFDQINAGIVILKQSGEVLFANKHFGELFDEPLFSVRTIEDLFAAIGLNEESRFKYRQLLGRVFSGEQFKNQEIRFSRHDKVKYVQANAFALRDSSGHVIASVVSMEDITATKRIEAELLKHRSTLEAIVSERTAELRAVNGMLEHEVSDRKRIQAALTEQSVILEAFFKHALNPVVIMDRNFNFIRVNDAYAQACQREVASFVGHNHFELYPHAQNKALFEQVVATRTPLQLFARPFSFPDHPEWGVTYWDWTLVPVCGKTGQVELLIFSLNDVTNQKKAQEEIASLSYFRETVIDSADTWLIVCDLQGKILIWNRAAEKISGYDRTEIVGREDPWELLYPEANYRRHIMEHFGSRVPAGEAIEDFEATIHTKTGQNRIICWNCRQLVDAGQAIGIIAIGRDITDKKLADEKLARYQVQLRQLSSQMSLAEEKLRRKISTELHDGLGQLLAVSKIRLGQVRQSSTNISELEILKEVVTHIENAIDYTRSLTCELSPPVLHELGFEAALSWLCEHVQGRHGIQCRFERQNSVDGLDHDFSVLMFQMIRELMHNIVKHAQACKVCIRLAAPAANCVRIDVIDDGVGFNATRLESRKDGFGLFNIRERLHHLNGKLEINSVLGRGTEVTITAPTKVVYGERSDYDNKDITR